MRLAGKMAVITGGASGIGRAGSELFVKEGAAVAIVDIDPARIDETVSAIEQQGGRAFGIVADLSNAKAAREFVRIAAKKLGGIDILWNNASTPGRQGSKALM